MTDREKVIKKIETIRFNLRQMNHGLLATFCDDAIAMLKEQEPVVRCKDCKHRGDRHKCIVAYVAEKQKMPYFFYDNRGEWFCADGERKSD